MNNVSLVGRLTRDPELKYTPRNLAVASFTIAVNRKYKNAKGEREADYINCVIWRQQAENLSNWCHKGSLVSLEGSIRTRKYENQQGQTVYVTEVFVDTFNALESREKNEHGQNQGASNPAAGTSKPQIVPDNASNNAGAFGGGDPFGGSSPMEISDDELPF